MLLAVCAAAVLIIVGTLRGQVPPNPNKLSDKEQQRLEFESQFPIAELNPTEIPSREEQAKRRAKSKRYDGQQNSINDDLEVTFSTRHWAEGLPALPVLQSNTIVIGKVRKAAAFVTDERSAVYSEFEIEPEEFLKNDDSNPLSAGNPLIVEREGGRVRRSSGRIGMSFTNGMGMPRVGRRYVFFLTHAFPYGGQQEQDFYILTAYELNAGHVYPIDDPGGGTHPISKYKNADEATLLRNLKSAIAQTAASPHD